MFYIDPLYMILVMPFVLLSLYASFRVKSTFDKYSRYSSYSRYTGAEAAKALLRSGGIYEVSVERGGGFLGDFYDPIRRRLSLSPEVYGSTSLAAIGVAAHEAGHAFQHAIGYLPLKIRSGLVPVAGIGSNAGWLMAIMGLIFNSGFLLHTGIVLFSMAVLFYLITLPVEYNASSRAVAMLTSSGIILPQEEKAVRDVLNAAALTYLAAALTAVGQLVYLLTLSSRE